MKSTWVARTLWWDFGHTNICENLRWNRHGLLHIHSCHIIVHITGLASQHSHTCVHIASRTNEEVIFFPYWENHGSHPKCNSASTHTHQTNYDNTNKCWRRTMAYPRIRRACRSHKPNIYGHVLADHKSVRNKMRREKRRKNCARALALLNAFTGRHTQ